MRVLTVTGRIMGYRSDISHLIRTRYAMYFNLIPQWFAFPISLLSLAGIVKNRLHVGIVISYKYHKNIILISVSRYLNDFYMITIWYIIDYILISHVKYLISLNILYVLYYCISSYLLIYKPYKQIFIIYLLIILLHDVLYNTLKLSSI